MSEGFLETMPLPKSLHLLTAFFVTGIVLACGCAKDGELSKDDDAKLRDNFNRPLTAEEASHLGGAKPVKGKPE